MIKKIEKNWPINMKKSFMIGNSKADEVCAFKSKLKFFYTNKNFDKIIKDKISNYL